jgi:hypothetical protein
LDSFVDKDRGGVIATVEVRVFTFLPVCLIGCGMFKGPEKRKVIADYAE